MDPEALAASTVTTNTTRKVRYAPKGPPRRPSNAVLPKVEKVEEEEANAIIEEELLRRLSESSSIRAKGKVDKKGPTQVAFGYGGSTSLRYAPLKGVKKLQSSSSDGDEQQPEKEYKEPWEHECYYPSTLPLRSRYTGNPEVLNEKEFGKASESMTYDEKSINPAKALDLFKEHLEDNRFFFQLPALVPIPKQQANAEDSETANNPKVFRGRACKFEDLPRGFFGKMLVYKSGAIKMKLGETLFDVSPGMDCKFSQDVVPMNIEEKHCCNIGELSRRATITPDVDSILESISNL